MNTTGWFQEHLRPFFASIDALVYSLIGWILEGIFNLATLTANSDLAKIIYNRIYVILALFMVFKLTFSFLQYMISPDTMSDKERGVGKLIIRIVVMLALIVMLPTIFFEPVIKYKNGEEATILNALQVGVLNTLPRIILGLDDGGESIKTTAKENGQSMALNMLQAFYYPSVCDENNEKVFNQTECTNIMGTGDQGHPVGSLEDFKATIVNTASNNSNYYEYQYMWPLTTIAGILLAVILLGIAVDVAVRTFKLLVLQVIAPVPVMSYIDPKSSKDGAFSSWLKNFTSTYLDIFIKLGTVYILLLLCSKLFDGGIFEENVFSSETFGGSMMARNFVVVFLTIGLFKFAKDAPKFIKDALGMKDSGGEGLFGGLKTLGAAAGVLGGATAGLVGGAAAGIGATAAAVNSAKKEGKKGVVAGLKAGLGIGGSALAGVGRGALQGGKDASKGNFIKGMSGAVAAQNAVTQRKISNAANGSTLWGRMGARAEDLFGIPNSDDAALEDAKNLSAAAANLKTIRDTAESKGFQNRSASIGNVSYRDSAGRAHVTNFAQGEHAMFKDLYENAAREGKSNFVFKGQTIDMTTAGDMYKNLTEAVSDNFLSSYTGGNAAIDSALNEYNQNIDAVSAKNSAGFTTLTSASGITDAYSKAVSSQGNTVKASVDPARVRKHKANREANKRGK